MRIPGTPTDGVSLTVLADALAPYATISSVNSALNTKLNTTGGAVSGLLSFSGLDSVGVRLKSLTAAQYSGLTPGEGDLFRDSTADRIDARLARGTVELLDSAGGQTIGGNLAATTLMVGGASGPLFRNNAGTIEARNNANSDFCNFTASQVTANIQVRTNAILRNSVATLSLFNGNVTSNFHAVTVPGSGGVLSNSSGIAGWFRIDSAINQTGTAGSTDFLINRTETAMGTGAHNFLDCQRAGVSLTRIDRTGSITTSGVTNFLGATTGTNSWWSATVQDVASGTFSISSQNSGAGFTFASNGVFTLAALNSATNAWAISSTDQHIRFPSTGRLAFSSTTSSSGSTDFNISRNAAGVGQIGTTANNALGSLLLTNLTAGGAINVGGSGVATPTTLGGTVLYARQVGSSAANWRGRIIAGGDNVAFLMGEYNSQAWLGGHVAALNAWAPLRINPDGTSDLHLGNTSTLTPGGTAILRLNNADSTAHLTGDMYVYNGANSTRIARTAGANGRLIIYRPNNGSAIAVQFGGGNDEIFIGQSAEGSLRANAGNLAVGTSGGLILDSLTNTFTFRGSASTTMATLTGSGNLNLIGELQLSTDTRMQRSVQALTTQVFDTSLAAWQTTHRSEASATGARFSVLGATPIVRQSLPAAASDAATTQALANSIRSLLINFGFAN